MLAIYYNVAIQTNHPTTQEVKTMTDNEKMIDAINRRLSGMTTAQLRIMFILATKLTVVNAQEQEAEESTN